MTDTTREETPVTPDTPVVEDDEDHIIRSVN